MPTTAAPAPTPTPAPTPAPAATAEVPLRDRPLAERIAATTATVPAPSAQTDGPVTVSAENCTLDGPPFVGGDSFSTIGPIAWSTDGSLYLADTDGKIRHYTVQPGDGCTLSMDTAFGENGLLAVGTGMGARVESIVSDEQGHVFVATSMRGTSRITAGHVDYQCDTRGRLAVSPDGTHGLAAFGSSGPQLVTFTDTGCSTAPLTLEGAPPSIEGFGFVSNERVIVGGQADVHAPHLVREYDLSGHPHGDAFGEAGDAMSADDHFCYVHSVVPCTHGLCFLDGNCRQLRVFDRDHAVLGAPNLSHAAGVEYPWFPSTTVVRDGVAFVTVNQQRGRASERTGTYDGFVMRLRGL
ncbi:MAG: hypothetical protein U0353_03160 [Sandaracinus sp.]